MSSRACCVRSRGGAPGDRGHSRRRQRGDVQMAARGARAPARARRARPGDVGHAERGARATAVDHVRRSTTCMDRRLAARGFASADVLLCPTLNVLPPPPGVAVGLAGKRRRVFRRRIRVHRHHRRRQCHRLGRDHVSRSARSRACPSACRCSRPTRQSFSGWRPNSSRHSHGRTATRPDYA